LNYSSSETQQAEPAAKAQPIDITREASVNFWLDKLGCSEWELRAAVAEVGPSASDVGNQLGKPL
jgi:Protein of unknown function (DUF3606)